MEGDLNGAMACNCSMCSAEGLSCGSCRARHLRVLTSEADVGTYTFNKQRYQAPLLSRRVAFTRTEKAPIQRVIGWPQSTFAASKESTWKACRFQHFDGRSL